MGGISIWQLLIILVIILLLFGSKKIRSIGGDLGAAMRGFKKEVNDDKSQDKPADGVEHRDDADFSQQEKRESSKEDSKRD